MNNNCEICGFLSQPKHQLFVTTRWSFGLGNEATTFGRAYVTLRVHKRSLSELDAHDWREFTALVPLLERAYKDGLGATLPNWSCLMNLAYNNPHVHWHLRPRFKCPPVLDGVAYPDEMFGKHYDPFAKRLVSDVVVERIGGILRPYFRNIPWITVV